MRADLMSRAAVEQRPPEARAGRPGGSALRERRAAARAQRIVDLLQRRPDLAGVHPPADLTAEAVRWSA